MVSEPRSRAFSRALSTQVSSSSRRGRRLRRHPCRSMLPLTVRKSTMSSHLLSSLDNH